jgi:hypothetical protein
VPQLCLLGSLEADGSELSNRLLSAASVNAYDQSINVSRSFSEKGLNCVGNIAIDLYFASYFTNGSMLGYKTPVEMAEHVRKRSTEEKEKQEVAAITKEERDKLREIQQRMQQQQ